MNPLPFRPWKITNLIKCEEGCLVERMWASVIGIYLLIGLVMQVLNMFLVPAFRKVLEVARKRGGTHFVVIGWLLGIFVWPVTLLVVFAAIKLKKIKRCPGCGSRIVLRICLNCGSVGKRALLIQEQKENRIRELSAIKDPELRNAALRAYAEVDADPLITQMVRKMSAMEENDPARKVLLQEVQSAIKGIYSRHTQPIIDRCEGRVHDAERRLAEHLESDHESAKR